MFTASEYRPNAKRKTRIVIGVTLLLCVGLSLLVI